MDLHASGIETIEQMRQADFNYTADCLEGKA
jgi:hypothetical protein